VQFEPALDDAEQAPVVIDDDGSSGARVLRGGYGTR